MAIDLNKLKEQYEKNKGNSEGGNFLKVPEGNTTIRILPSKDGESFFVASKQHKINENGQFKYIHCPKVIGEKCPICEAHFALWRMSNASDDAKGLKEFGANGERGKNNYATAAKALKPTPAYYMNVVVRPSDEVKVLNAAPTLMESIMTAFKHSDLGDLTDFEKGFDFIITRDKGDNGFTRYTNSQPRTKPTVAGTPQQIAAWMEGIKDLGTLIKYEDYAELDKIAKNIMSQFATKVSETPQVGGASTPDEGNYLDRLKS